MLIKSYATEQEMKVMAIKSKDKEDRNDHSLERNRIKERILSRHRTYGIGRDTLAADSKERNEIIATKPSLSCGNESLKSSIQESWGRMQPSFRYSDTEHSPVWAKENKVKRHSFKTTKSEMSDAYGYEPEYIGDGCQSSLYHMVHSKTEDFGMICTSQQRRMSSLTTT